MPDRGKLVVLSFFLLAAVLAGGAMWYHFAKTRWAMAFWGNDAARLIVRAPEVEVWRLTSAPRLDSDAAASPTAAPLGQSLDIGGETLFVSGRRPLVAAPGLIHMRMALVEDANFDTLAPQPTEQNWDYAFRFYSSEQELIVAIDSQHGYVRTVGGKTDNTQPIATITPIATGLKRFLEEQFKVPQKKLEPAKQDSKKPPALETVPTAK
jgi:hypothetical protein